MDHVDVSTRHRVTWAVLAVVLAYVPVREVTSDAPSAVSIVVRATGLATCAWSLVAPVVEGRKQRRSARGNAAD